MNKTLTKKPDTQGNSGLLPYPVITAAVSGNVDAINTVLKHFEDYIAKLSTRTMYDEAEKSHRHDCDMKNPNGNELDQIICEEVKKLADENSDFLKKLGDSKKLVNKNCDDYTQQIKTLNERLALNGRKIGTLLDRLSETDDITSEYVNNKIKELHQDNEAVKVKIQELEALNKNALLSDTEFDFIKDMMISFAESFDRMTVEQKRRALRTFIKRIIWDGETVRVCFFGSKSEEDAEMDLLSELLPPLYDGLLEPQQRGRL